MSNQKPTTTHWLVPLQRSLSLVLVLPALGCCACNSEEDSTSEDPPDNSTSETANSAANQESGTSGKDDAGCTDSKQSNNSHNPDDNKDTDGGVPKPPDASANKNTDDAQSLIEAAKSDFWTAFTQEQHERHSEVVDKLEAAYELDPKHANNTLLLAHTYLWKLGEFGRFPEPDPSELPSLAGGAARFFSESFQAAPEDYRVLAWLGSMTIADGAQRGDQETIDKGREMIAGAVQGYPEFALFVSSLQGRQAPKGSEQFNQAVEDIYRLLDVCTGEPLDREAPDWDALFEAIDVGTAHPTCGNGPRAPHNLEGVFLYFGDLLVKAGSKELAEQSYAAARKSPAYDQWPYQWLLEEREQQLEERLALYLNEDPADDPPVVTDQPFACASCHAAAPDEPRP